MITRESRPRGAAPGPGRSDQSLQAASDTTVLPRWTGCPAGCALDHHEHDWQIVTGRCGYCTSLDMAARESLHDCSMVCPLQAVAS